MKVRAAKFVVAIVASILSSANLIAAPDNTDQAGDKCLTSPGDKTPPGGHWRYRIERGTGRQCWYLKGDSDKAARKAPEETAAADEPAPTPPRKKAAAPRSLSDARAEFSRVPVEPDTGPAPIARGAAPATGLAVADGNQASPARDANMMAPGAVVRWPDPMSAVNPGAKAPVTPPDQTAEARPAPAPAAVPPPQIMPRAVPPVPVSEKPLSLPMLITIIAGGLSVLGLIVSILFGWRASRISRLTPSAPMPPLEEFQDQGRRPGDLYRERRRMRASGVGKRHAA